MRMHSLSTLEMGYMTAPTGAVSTICNDFDASRWIQVSCGSTPFWARCVKHLAEAAMELMDRLVGGLYETDPAPRKSYAIA